MSAELEAVPMLPPVPSRNTPATQHRGRAVLRRAGQALANFMIAPDWDRTVMAAQRDPQLNVSEWWVLEFPGPASSATPTRRKVSAKDLSGDSRAVFLRLRYLVDQVTQTLDCGNPVLSDIARGLRQYGQSLLWEAAVDLALADRLTVEAGYSRTMLSVIPPHTRAQFMRQVEDLRARVLFAIEGLSTIQAAALRGDAASRLSQTPVEMPLLEDAIIWFQCFTEAHEEQARRDEPPPRRRRWWW